MLRYLRVFCWTLLGLALSQQANAYTLYSDRIAWELALAPATQNENFDGFAGTYAPNTLGSATLVNTTEIEISGEALEVTGGVANQETFEFAEGPVYSIGLDWVGNPNGLNASLQMFGDSVGGNFVIPASFLGEGGATTGFVAIVADSSSESFLNFTIRSTGNTLPLRMIDNVTIALPEPATLTLAAFASLAVLRRRRR